MAIDSAPDGANDSPQVRKQALRVTAIARRNGLDGEFRCRAARHALLNLMRVIRLEPTSRVAVFWPIGCEFDTRPLLNALAALGVETCLPRVVGRDQPLVFHRHRPGDALLEGPMRVLQPLPEQPVCRPDIVIVPLLAFDGDGYRLGYGGGFYDRTLALLGDTVTAIGIGFDAQRVPSLPHEATDVPLRTIVTEIDIHRFF